MVTKNILKICVSDTYRVFDYLAHPDIENTEYQVGQRVLVPFRKKSQVGFIIAVTNTTKVPRSKLKHILSVLKSDASINANLMQLFSRMSQYYHAEFPTIFEQCIPKLIRSEASVDRLLVYYIAKPWNLGCQKKLTSTQSKLWKWLSQQEQGVGISEINLAGFRKKTLDILLEKKTITQIEKTKVNLIDKNTTKQSLPKLTAEQVVVINKVKQANGFNVFVLMGVTGSGKSEVYLQTITPVIAQGLQVLVLVPEIGLTPQVVTQFKQRFNREVVCLHSGLSDVERAESWLKASTGIASVVIGTRSAIFTPLKQLGLIIIDEEHDESYKQQNGIRYSARDMAILRGKLEGVSVLLGSATPSLECVLKTQKKGYHLLQMKHRVGGFQQPSVKMIDVKGKKLQKGLSIELVALIRTHLERGEQVLVFLNRRGYAPVVLCHACGWIAYCKSCDAKLTFHKKANKLKCHHCKTQQAMLIECPDCKQTQPQTLGLGTEQLAQSLQAIFPDNKLLRVDRDVIKNDKQMTLALDAAKKGKGELIIGTQMLAKGHHIPNLTLAVILNTDNSLYSTDFRATEKLAQLIIQVAGRAGRARNNSRVVIQTYMPEHQFYQNMQTLDYAALAEKILTERSQAKLPPYSYLVFLRADHPKDGIPMHFLTEIKNHFKQQTGQFGINCDGPIADTNPKKAGKYCAFLMFKGECRGSLAKSLRQLLIGLRQWKVPKHLSWNIDIDPTEM